MEGVEGVGGLMELQGGVADRGVKRAEGVRRPNGSWAGRKWGRG